VVFNATAINMRIKDDALKCVVFIGMEIVCGSAKTKQWCGTGFLVSRPSNKFTTASFVYLVTAKHVVAEIGKRDFIVRINTKDGKSADFHVHPNIKWFFHPKEDESSDVAVYPLWIDTATFATLDYAAISTKMFVTDTVIQSADIGVGDEVFMIGLFAHYSGNEKNFPIVRTGNIAMIPSEPIPTSNFGNMEVYLIESRSIGGLSGSPVFVLKEYEIGRWRFHLLGLVHGHWQVDSDQIIDASTKDSKTTAGVNVGIAMVTPAKKILETIEQEKLSEIRSKIEKDFIDRNSPTPD
jgi:hypothetical protein